jgi:hypothetical protein
MRTVLIVIGLVLVCAVASAQGDVLEPQHITNDVPLNDIPLTEIPIDELNELLQGQELPGLVKTLFGDERVIIHIRMDGTAGENTEEFIVSVVTERGILQGVKRGPIENPTLNMYADEETVRNIMTSTDPLRTFRTALDNKEIRYEAVGVVKKVKFGILSVVSKIFSWF